MPLLEGLLREEKFKGMAVFQVDFDKQKDFLRGHKVRWQSTLIVFKGKSEKGRTTGDLDPASIRQLLEKGF
ncbi:MAG: thioredoxin family protein [Candidatus Tectomicrobia bacterium]|nr:thioredoxin family protein [Candidatus Tectomicrobia bacterium]